MLSCRDHYAEHRSKMTVTTGNTSANTTENRIAGLPCWNNPVGIEPLSGGMTNLNFKVTDGDQAFVVRLGEDDPMCT